MFFSFYCAGANAQKFQFRTYSFNNGLSSYNAGKMLQDKYGFVWICTQEGINRFDGKDFISIKKDPLQNTGLSENYITDAVVDDDGKLWIASALGGIDVLNPENFKIEKRLQADVKAKTSLITNWVRSLSWSPRQELWIGTYYGLNVYKKNTNSFTSFTENPFKKNNDLNICFTGRDSLNNMWIIAENDGAIIFNTATKEIITKISKEDFGISSDDIFSVKSLFIDNPKSVYLCTNKGLKHVIFNNQKYTPAKIENPYLAKLNEVDIRGIVKDNFDRIWVGTETGIKVFENPDSFEHITHSNFFFNTILDDNINYIYNDHFGNMWVTTTKGLNLLINDQFRFQAFNSKAGVLSEMRNINTLYPDSDSVIYVCASTGLFKINIRNFATTHILKSGKYGEIESLVRINQNSLIASSLQKLIYIKNQNDHYYFLDAADIFKELVPIRFNYFSSCLKLNDSVILMGSMEDAGLLKWDIKHHTLRQYKNKPGDSNSLHENNIHNLKKDRSGNVWLLSNKSISKYDPLKDVFTSFIPRIENNKILPHIFFDLYDDGRYLWITSYGYGLLRFDARHQIFTSFTEKNGFSSNATYNIISESDSVLWVSSNKGLTRFNTATGKAASYFYNDGLQSDAFDEGSACKIGSAIFFGGIDGFTQITKNPLFVISDKVPAYIGKITFTNAAGRAVEINSLNPEKTNLAFQSYPITFHIISPDYRNNNRDYYFYKIDELSSSWISMGQKKEITLAGLSPGVYHFQAQINSAGYTSVSEKLIFTIVPEWYQTFLFKMLIAVVLIVLLYGLYRYRIKQLMKQQQIRRDIASDLHDDFGATLNSVKIYTHLIETSNNKQEYINLIKESLKQAAAGLRDMIWVLDDKQDTVEELINRIKQFALPLGSASNVSINLSADLLSNTKLKKTEKRNLLLLLKEAINNSIKYANCKNITIVFQRLNGKITLIIEDDGCGFDNLTVIPGNGLKNIQERARQVNFTSTISSVKGKGTKIVITEKN